MSVPQSEPHLPREVCPQAEADGQAAAPVDDPSHPHHGNIPRNLVIRASNELCFSFSATF